METVDPEELALGWGPEPKWEDEEVDWSMGLNNPGFTNQPYRTRAAPEEHRRVAHNVALLYGLLSNQEAHAADFENQSYAKLRRMEQLLQHQVWKRGIAVEGRRRVHRSGYRKWLSDQGYRFNPRKSKAKRLADIEAGIKRFEDAGLPDSYEAKTLKDFHKKISAGKSLSSKARAFVDDLSERTPKVLTAKEQPLIAEIDAALAKWAQAGSGGRTVDTLKDFRGGLVQGRTLSPKALKFLQVLLDRSPVVKAQGTSFDYSEGAGAAGQLGESFHAKAEGQKSYTLELATMIEGETPMEVLDYYEAENQLSGEGMEQLLGLKPGTWARARKKEKLTKGLATKLLSHIPGIWSLDRIGMGKAQQYGGWGPVSTKVYVDLLRGDGARLTWSTSLPGWWDRDEGVKQFRKEKGLEGVNKVHIVRGQLGQPKAKSEFIGRSGQKFIKPASRWLNRAVLAPA